MIIAAIPGLFMAISAIFFYWNFVLGDKSYWWKFGIGLMSILLAFIQLIYWVVFSDLGLLVFFGAIFASLIAFLSGLLFFFLPLRVGKTVGILIGLIIPVFMFVTLWFAQDFSPTSVLRKNGIILATAIDQYKKDLGHYPQTLQELLPKYVSDLKKPNDYWGWLYVSTDQDFTLGYVFGVDKWGCSVCVIRSMNRNWDCLINSSGPFKLEPTPFPTLPPAW
jgi:hypothetical protein